MSKKIIIIGFISFVMAWMFFCLAVYLFPQAFFYNPSEERSVIDNAHNNDFPADEVYYSSSDGTRLYGWFVKPQQKDKVIVFFHGNSYNIEAFYHKLIPFIEVGYGAFIGEYRGFGGIKGTINQKNLANDAIAMVRYLNNLGYKNDDIILYGMSLGSFTSLNTAAELGQDMAFSSVILEVPFDSVLNVVKQRIISLFPFDLIVRDKYDNTKLINKINSPILIMGGSKDNVVPIERAKSLLTYANHPKKIIIYSGAEHSSLYNYRNWQDILNWLERDEKVK